MRRVLLWGILPGGLLLFALPGVSPAQSEPSQDPRIQLVELQEAGDLEGALAATKAIEQRDPALGSNLGLPFLRAHLLEQLGEKADAANAFAEVLSHPSLQHYARLRIALLQEELDHPEVAAGLAATLLGSRPGKYLLTPTARVLERTVAAGGDCRLVANLETFQLPSDSRRRLQITRADCHLQQGDLAATRLELNKVLNEKITDLAGREAAYRLLVLDDPKLEDGASSGVSRLVTQLGKTFHHHREFERAAAFLSQETRSFPERLNGPQYETYYAYARADFWLGNYSTAGRRYFDLAQRAPTDGGRAQAYYNEARSHELSGNWDAALLAYQKTYETSRTGRFSSASLIGELRLHWRRSEEKEALAILDTLRARRSWSAELARAALFLAVSDISQERSDRAAAWLDMASAASRSMAIEVDFWRGRLAELDGRINDAVDQYLLVLSRDPYHPLGLAAQRRLQRPDVNDIATRRGQSLAQSQDKDEQREAWLLLGSKSPAGRAARDRYLQYLTTQTSAASFVDLAPVAVADWPLWRSTHRTPEEQLLGLGMWHEGAPVATRYFPIVRPELALTAGQRLIEAGQVRRGLLIAQILHERKPPSVPDAALSPAYRRILYPYAFSDLLSQASDKYEIDPYLLAAIIRQESAFEATAVSQVSARGLTQFVHDTAVRLASRAGLEGFSPGDLENPEVAIGLGGVYLQDLGRRYDGRVHQMVAAYNAGEQQAEQWQSYCYTTDPEEFFSKVTFRETRNYLIKVLSGRAQYREIYLADGPFADPTDPASSSDSAETIAERD